MVYKNLDLLLKSNILIYSMNKNKVRGSAFKVYFLFALWMAKEMGKETEEI